ncbi:tripartite motif-containing protein 16-like [Stegastes partitus]|uniref:Tripartite motif-containing protein 16-like n=1 Tax=Stegastes partitus TaxID=144197 RepID=A0A3B4ZX78_9TELE|nr:PREDICTED: tripartite motif-containing protein 16-like [Stegastes partitus]
MAQQRFQMDQEKLSCSICLDLLKDPVTIPCGHSYCMNCIRSYWDKKDRKQTHSCPQCRQTFRPRPKLKKNTMLADLVEEVQKTEPKAAPADLCYAGPGDVSCDVCTGRKLKAVKSCLQCLVSYCEQHLQPHYQSPAFEKHKLVDPSTKLQENICSQHNEVMKIFCRTDQQCICYLCTMDEHKGHDTVPAETERTKRQKEVRRNQQRMQQRITEKEKCMRMLQQEVEAVNQSADKAVSNSEKIFKDLIRLIEKRSSEVKQQIRSKQKDEVCRFKELQEELQQEISELRRKYSELEKLSNIEDHSEFLHVPPSQICDWTDSPSCYFHPLSHFEDSMAAVSKSGDKLWNVLSEELSKFSATEVDLLLPQSEPKTRAEFLQYSCGITLDPNTAHMLLILSDENRKVTTKETSFLTVVQLVVEMYGTTENQSFTDRIQVLSRESLTGRCYWEVEWTGVGVSVAVSYKGVRRKREESEYGNNDKSWALQCENKGFTFTHDKRKTSISVCQPRIGVYLDHSAGVLSFYSVSDTMTLIHRVQTTFTEPLHAGLQLQLNSTAELCELK